MPGERELVITPDAESAISAMAMRVDLIGQTFGTDSEEYIDLLRSFNSALLSVLRLGGHVYRDGELSLYGRGFIDYGVIWFAQNRSATCILGEWSTHS